jgi:hypothetical protein
MIVRILGYKARVCNLHCKSGFQADRESGLNYGLHVINGIPAMHREQWSLATCKCAYCGSNVKGRVPVKLKEKFGL